MSLSPRPPINVGRITRGAGGRVSWSVLLACSRVAFQMRTHYRRFLLCAALALASTACRGGGAKYQELTVPALAELHQRGVVRIYDVNTDGFRAAHGKIPGAILLASSHSYDLSLLPKEKADTIAFYCSSRL